MFQNKGKDNQKLKEIKNSRHQKVFNIHYQDQKGNQIKWSLMNFKKKI